MALQKRTLFLTVILFVIVCLGGCKKQENEKITSIEQLNEPACTIGVPEGGAGMYMAEKYLPKAEHKTFSGNTSGYLAKIWERAWMWLWGFHPRARLVI